MASSLAPARPRSTCVGRRGRRGLAGWEAADVGPPFPTGCGSVDRGVRGGCPFPRTRGEVRHQRIDRVAHLKRRGVERRPFRKLRGDQLDRAMALYAAGQSLRSVAVELGLSKEAVRSGLAARGVEIRPQGRRRA